MTHPSRRDSPKTHAPGGSDESFQNAEGEVDATERFSHEESVEGDEDAPMILSVPPDADEADLALTQPLPRVEADGFDEELIRTRELPMADDAWLQEMLDAGEQSATRARLRSRSGKDSTGQFPHPALTPRPPTLPSRSPSSDDLPPWKMRTPEDDTATRIHEAYLQYFALCQKHAQAVVGEEVFTQRLRGRLLKLGELYPQKEIVFRPVVENGNVRVRVLLARKK